MRRIKETNIHRAIDLFALLGFAEPEKELTYWSRFSDNIRKISFLDEFIKLA
jgi:hypothetical protein